MTTETIADAIDFALKVSIVLSLWSIAIALHAIKDALL